MAIDLVPGGSAATSGASGGSGAFGASGGGGDAWWVQALGGNLAWTCGGLLVGGALVLILAMRAMLALQRVEGAGPGVAISYFARTCRHQLARLRSDQGTATVEFVLVFPVILVICLMLLQTVLVFTGNLFVHYAAFCATRAAIVEAPTGIPGGGGRLAVDSSQFRAVSRAAAFALIPVSGRTNPSGGASASFVAGLNDLYSAYQQTPPNWVANLAAQRFAYALTHTQVRLYTNRITSSGAVDIRPATSSALGYGPKDPVTLGVTHRLNLAIPYVSLIFRDGNHATVGGNTPYTNVTATCTLPLEGYDVNLPPQPTIERRP